MACAMTRKCRFRFGWPIVGRPSVGRIGPGCQPVLFAALANIGARQCIGRVLSDSKSLIQKARSGFSDAGSIIAIIRIYQ